MANKIAVQMLCGRNEEPFLQYALQSVRWADYVTIVNTDPASYWGTINAEIVDETSADLRLELRMKYLIPEKDGLFSFAEARNLCLSMTDEDDFVLIVDADEVHFPELKDIYDAVREYDYDSMTCNYYHLVGYKNLYQEMYQRMILYRNYSGTRWRRDVHEYLEAQTTHPLVIDYNYMHYSYIKGQRDVFNRWKFNEKLEKHFNMPSVFGYIPEDADPENIISDRIAIGKEYIGEHPPVVQDFLKGYPECKLHPTQ